MSEKINAQLARECELSREAAPQREIPVVVTLNDWSRRSEVEQAGLRVNHSFEIIKAMSGTLTCAEVEGVAKLDQVEKIEFDGEFRAIKKDAGGGN